MRSRPARIIAHITAVCLFALAALPVQAQFWTSYTNARFGYALDIPPGYEGQGESDNGDGQLFYLPNRQHELRVWGGWSTVTADNFEGEVANRLSQDLIEGWLLSYQASTPQWATWSATRGRFIMYQRMITLCDGDSYAAFRAVYPAQDLSDMHETIEGLVRSFVPTAC
ncbi:MAG: hypothetical protein KIT02_16620 [Devosia sp.]|uniref:hypothetical protein n=1 Tax=Devosia sp. TaxID=1871048 RepID=UPI0024C6C666|nr:hypothetical protein [Devosia sp.]UYN99505.1 MAG: hypothetical protein KIT02_16620 [Devosia sp.]